MSFQNPRKNKTTRELGHSRHGVYGNNGMEGVSAASVSAALVTEPRQVDVGDGLRAIKSRVVYMSGHRPDQWIMSSTVTTECKTRSDFVQALFPPRENTVICMNRFDRQWLEALARQANCSDVLQRLQDVFVIRI